MSSSGVKTLVSRHRFPEDAQDVVALTSKQHAYLQSIHSSMRHFLSSLTRTTNYYHKMLDSMLQCLDLSWDSTGQMDSSIAGMVNSMKDIVTRMHETLPIPLEEQMDRHKSLQSQLDRWKSHSSRLDRKLKEFDSVQFKSKNQQKKERAKYNAEDAMISCQEEAVALKPCLNRLNVEGVRSCCQIWLNLSHYFDRFSTELQPYFMQLNQQAAALKNQATSGDLPAWTEKRTKRNSKARLSTLSAMTSYADSNFDSSQSFQSSALADVDGKSSFGKRGPVHYTESYYAQPASSGLPSTWTKYSEQPEYSKEVYSVAPKHVTTRPNHTQRTSRVATRRYCSSEAIYPEQSMVSLRSNSVVTIVPEFDSSQTKPNQIDGSSYVVNGIRRSRSTEPIHEVNERTISCGSRILKVTDVSNSTKTTPDNITPSVVMSYQRYPLQNATDGLCVPQENQKRESTASNYSIEYQTVTATPYRRIQDSPSTRSEVTIRGDYSDRHQ